MDIRYARGFDCNYDSYTNCEDAGCDDICRCSTYDLSSFSATIVDAFSAFTKLSDQYGDTESLFNYRFLSHLDLALYPIKYIFNDCIALNRIRDLEIVPNIVNEYYGEELESIELTNSLAVYEDINNQLSVIFDKYGLGTINTRNYDEPKDRHIIEQHVLALIKFALSKTNNNIYLPEVEKSKKYYLQNITLGELLQTVFIPNHSYLKRLRHNKEWNMIKQNIPYSLGLTSSYPSGILLKKNNKLFLIDGYHRYLTILLHHPNIVLNYIVLEV